MKKIEKKCLIWLLVGAGVLFLIASYYIHSQQSEYVSMMKVLVAQQETTLTSIAEVTDRNGADAVVENIIQDCQLEDRQRFDELLGSLETLKRNQLTELDTLFNSCGSFYAQRKALMVARLQREFEVYKDYVTLLTVVDSREKTIEYPVEKWAILTSFETKRSNLSSELVKIQKDIIEALLQKVAIQSDEMKDKVSQAQEIKDNLSLLGVKIDSLRADVIDL